MPAGAGEWKENDPLSAAKLNANDKLNVRQIRVGPGLQIQRNANSGDASITLDPPANPWPILRVVVTEKPGSGTPDVAGVTCWDGTNMVGAQFYAEVRAPESTGGVPAGGSDPYYISQADIIVTRPFGGVSIGSLPIGGLPPNPLIDPNGQPVLWQQITFPHDLIWCVPTAKITSQFGFYTGSGYQPAGQHNITPGLTAPVTFGPFPPSFPVQIENLSEYNNGSPLAPGSRGGWALLNPSPSTIVGPFRYLCKITGTTTDYPQRLVVECQGIPGVENYFTMESSSSQNDTVYTCGGTPGGIQNMGARFKVLAPGIGVIELSIDSMGITKKIQSFGPVPSVGGASLAGGSTASLISQLVGLGIVQDGTSTVSGFTGTGTYTNFTIVNGIITAAS